MTSILIAVILGMIAYIIKALIDINALVLQIIKDKEVNKIPNELEKNYQFIKGLY
jgi:hypothetical protein